MIRGVGWANDGLTKVQPSAFRGVAASLKVTDVTWARCQGAAGAPFVLGWLDKILDDWGGDAILVVRSAHPWLTHTTIPAPSLSLGVATGTASAPPVSMDLYSAFMRALAGHVRGRVSAIVVESAAQDPAHWLGSLGDYLALLAAARTAIKAVAPEILVVTAGFEMGDFWDDAPSSATAEARWSAIPDPYRTYYASARAFLEGQLAAAPGLADACALHSNGGNGRGLTAALAWGRSLVGHAMPWWVDDATSAPLLTVTPGLSWNPWKKPSELNRLLYALSLGVDFFGSYKADIAAYREAQRVEVADKLAAAQAAGVERIYFDTLGDWRLGGSLLAAAATGYPLQGLANDDGSLRPAANVIRAAAQGAAEAA